MNKKITMMYIIGILLIGIIVITIILVDMKKAQKEPNQIEVEDGAVTSEEMYCTVQSNIQKYLTFANVDITKKSEQNALGGRQTTAEIFRIYSEEDKKRALLDFIDKEYIEENKITEDNLEEFINITSNEVQRCSVDDIKVKQADNNIEFYAIEVSWKSTDKETNEEINKTEKFIMKIDKNNKTYSVKPTEELNLEEEKNSNSIDKNTRNTYTEITLNDGELVGKYVEKYKNMMLNNPEKAYEYLDEEYRNERFENVDNFKKYVESFKDEISGISTVQYIKRQQEGYEEYVSKDQYENLMVFNVKSVMDFTVKLDTYTILTEENKELYNNASEEDKVSLNAQRVIDMLNNRDYHTIYRKLDQGFKDNHSLTEEKLTDYFKEYYFPKHYTYKIKNVDRQSDIYILEIYLYEKGTEEKDEDYSGKMQFMIKLKEDMDFTLSFGYVNF